MIYPEPKDQPAIVKSIRRRASDYGLAVTAWKDGGSWYFQFSAGFVSNRMKTVPVAKLFLDGVNIGLTLERKKNAR
jgi:hypothetical protein